MDFEQKAKKVIKENIIDFVSEVIKCPVSDLSDLIEKHTVATYHTLQTIEQFNDTSSERPF